MTKGNGRFLARLAPALALLGLCVSLSAQDRPAFRPGRLIVVPKAGAEAKLENFRKGKRHKLRKRFERLAGILVIETDPKDDPDAVAREYAASGLVEAAEPDYILRALDLPNDPDLSRLWSFQSSTNAGADIAAAWDARNSAENVIVAVIDSGVRYTHEDLAGNMWVNPRETANNRDDDGNGIVDDLHGIDAAYNTGDPWDDNGHGTHVSGTIGAVANNGKGIAGVCWKVQIMACKFMDWSGEGDTSDAIDCINYARRNGARVINASWGGSHGSYALRSAISAARNAGIIFVAAAGNEGMNNDYYPSYPANYSLDNVVSVAASDRSGGLDIEYSNYGARTVDIAAPGTGIYSTWNTADNAYVSISGTSMATPHVAGAVALLRAAHPAESHQAIITRLYAAADKFPSLEGRVASGGRLNLARLFPAPPPVDITDLPREREPVAILSVSMQGLGGLRLGLPAGAEDYQIQSSTNLIDWIPVETQVADGMAHLSATNSPQFFRLAAPQ